jgi:hypothetical protein
MKELFIFAVALGVFAALVIGPIAGIVTFFVLLGIFYALERDNAKIY